MYSSWSRQSSKDSITYPPESQGKSGYVGSAPCDHQVTREGDSRACLLLSVAHLLLPLTILWSFLEIWEPSGDRALRGEVNHCRAGLGDLLTPSKPQWPVCLYSFINCTLDVNSSFNLASANPPPWTAILTLSVRTPYSLWSLLKYLVTATCKGRNVKLIQFQRSRKFCIGQCFCQL